MRVLPAVRAPGVWERANRELLAKLLSELTFEDVLVPAVDGDRLTVSFGALELSASAELRALGHWRVDAATLVARRAGVAVELPDAADLVALGAPLIGADAATTAGLVNEVTATVVADAVQLHRGRPANELVDADPLVLEGELRGHPWIVASKGRAGFDLDDLDTFTPEAGRRIRLDWLAVDPSRVDLQAVDGLDCLRLPEDQLGGAEAQRLRALGPSGAVLMPVHPWQWRERIAALHAGDVARGAITWLGPAAPEYLPRQSIRTLADADHPLRRELKLSVSILNTSVYRGLPRKRTLAAPALTQWLTGCVDGDPFLRETGLILLGEVASASVGHPAFEAIDGVPYQHTELLGAIWREPVAALLADGERALPLAALIHTDPAGCSLVELLIARSGLTVADWVARLHEISLPPLLHLLYRHGVTCSPHGQNCLVVLRDDVPVRLVIKDFVDDATIAAEALPELAELPADVRAALGDGVEAAIITQWIQCGLFVCVHRYLADLLEERMGLPEATFWRLARDVVDHYQARFEASLGDRFALFDFDAPAFVKLCLNRVRILERGYRDGPERPIAAAAGWVENPLVAA